MILGMFAGGVCTVCAYNIHTLRSKADLLTVYQHVCRRPHCTPAVHPQHHHAFSVPLHTDKQGLQADRAGQV
ncbi:hypothetical protein QBC46DRAFT_396681, partial [Diplogelasinospora grovesii]